MREEIIGDCRLILGDCRAALRELSSVDAIITDPPYGNDNHNGDWNARLNAHRGIADKPIANDAPDSMREVVDAMLREAARLLPKVSACACFCGGGGGLAPCLHGLPSAWTAMDCSSFTRSYGTSAIPALGSVSGGNMKC